MTGSIISDVGDSEAAKGAAPVPPRLGSTLALPLVFVHVVEPGSPGQETDAIVRRLERPGSSYTTDLDREAGCELAGGIVRFGLGKGLNGR